MPGYDRTDRINEEIRRELDAILRTEVKDPRIPELFTLTTVQTSRDLSQCKVGVSTMLGEQENRDMLKALKSAQGFVRRALGQRVQLRHTPELLFHLDQNIAYGVHIAKVLNDLHAQEDAEAGEEAPRDE